MTKRHYILATAGHVDHGKSALVKALTGIDPDRLPEEKSRGITIDLGFAHLELPDPREPERNKFVLGLVDVPGHEDFVKNMVAGVGSIDLALLVVAADDGWMPQTEEHLQILTYLGVSRAIVALTKIDLAKSAESAAVEAIRDRLTNSPFAEAPIVPTSVITGEGIEELKAALAGLLSKTPPPEDLGKPRLPVDRVFQLRGVGTIVTGTLSGGVLKRGQNIAIQPNGQPARIRSLQTHNHEVEESGPGTRTALNLPDVSSHGESGGSGIERGQVVTLPEFHGPSEALDVVVFKSSRVAGSESGAGRPIKSSVRVQIHHGSGHFAGKLLFLDANQIGPGESAVGQIRAEAPVFAFAGDRLIVRDWSERWTLGGGIILDPDATGKNFKSPEHRRFLQTRAAAPDSAAGFVASQLEFSRVIGRNGFLAKSRFSQKQIAEASAAAVAAGSANVLGEWIIDGSWWKQILQTAIERIDLEHTTKPQRLGLELNDLRSELLPRLLEPQLFEHVQSQLTKNGFVQSGTVIRRSSHRAALPAQLQAAGAKVRSALHAKPFDPPSKKELAPDLAAQQALKFLIETGEAIEIGDGIVLLAESVFKMAETVRATLRQRGRATASELRQAVGASRRIIIPFLEKLDRDGVTRREGDVRVLRQK